MEDFTEVSMEQEFSAVAEQPMPSPHGCASAMPSPHGEGGTERSPASEVTDEVFVEQETNAAGTENTAPKTNEDIQNETENAAQAGPEDGAAGSNGEESREAEYPETNTDVFAAWQELAREHPEVVGKPLPDDIMQACMQSDLPPLRVYESMMLKKQGEEINALKEEIATLRQNADAAARAPVTAASTGGNEGNDPNDHFMLGFNS